MVKNYQVGKYFLDDYQMQLLNNDNNTIVIAGAGSGKTLTIIGKINYLIEMKKVNPEEILIISFTNASVNDIKNKLNYDNIDVYTFHKLAINILNKANFNYTLANDTLLSYIVEEEIKTCDIKEQKNILKFLNINNKFSIFLNSNAYQSFVKLILTFINLWKTNNYKFTNIPLKKYNNTEKQIILFIFKILQKYNYEKISMNKLDFDDLILTATKVIKNINLNYKYIFIDEFQDSSFIRLNLIREIYKYNNTKVIVVGDDWQSIYRFSGCDLSIFLNFPKYFPNVTTIKLVNTYRNSQELINIASTFVMKNNRQITKNLLSFKKNTTPFIFVPYQNGAKTLKKIIDYLLNETNDILILSRNNKDIFNYLDEEIKYDNNFIIYKNYQLKYLTVHKSKGLEAKYTILLNCNNTTLGFPNKIENNKIIDKLFSEKEIKYAEERRLFYVALTRCKEQTFLLYAKNNPSIFIKEIKKIVKKKLGFIKYF